MKIWVLINPPPVSEDTAYLIGRATSRSVEVCVNIIAPSDDRLPAPPDQRIDAILNRSFNTHQSFLTQLDAVAADLDIPAVNPGAASYRACDKRSYIDDFPDVIPVTQVAHSLDDITRLRDALDDDVVLKNPYGKQGKEVIRYAGAADDAAALALLANAKESGVVAQAFCRDFVAGDKRIILHRNTTGGFDLAAWFERVPEAGHWKSNISAGGRIVPCDLDDDERAFAQEVAQVAGLDYIGIDMARQDGRCLLIETNAYTGGHINFDTDRRAHSGDDFAAMILRLAEEGRG